VQLFYNRTKTLDSNWSERLAIKSLVVWSRNILGWVNNVYYLFVSLCGPLYTVCCRRQRWL